MAASPNRRSLLLAGMAVPAAAMPLRVAAATASDALLEELTARAIQASRSLTEHSRRTDIALIGHEPADEEDEAWDAANDEHEAAAAALFAYQPRDARELAAKVAAADQINARSMFTEEMLDAICTDIGRLGGL